MNKFLGIFFGVVMVVQFAAAGSYDKEKPMDAGDQADAAAAFEQTLEDSPTAAGMSTMKEDGQAAADQAAEQVEFIEAEEVDMVMDEEPMDDTPQQ